MLINVCISRFLKYEIANFVDDDRVSSWNARRTFLATESQRKFVGLRSQISWTLNMLLFWRNVEDHGRVDFVTYPEGVGKGPEMLLGLVKFKMWHENLKFIGIKKRFADVRIIPTNSVQC